MQVVHRSAGDPVSEGAESTAPTAVSRVLRVVLVTIVALSPLVISIRVGGAPSFTWRMFSLTQEPVTYEVSTPRGWVEVETDGLSWWERGEHVGTGNLSSLCAIHEEAAVARRIVGDDIDAQVTCR